MSSQCGGCLSLGTGFECGFLVVLGNGWGYFSGRGWVLVMWEFGSGGGEGVWGFHIDYSAYNLIYC